MIIFISCKSTQDIVGICNLDNAILISDKLIKKTGYKIEKMYRKVEDKQEYYLIHYHPTDSLMQGNSAEIKVDKNTCKIIGRKFYQ